MLKRSYILIALPLILFHANNSHAQSFVNGSFETNTAAMCDYNLFNGTFTSEMTGGVAYGGGNELDIMQSTCPYGPSQAGTWFVGLAAPGGVSDAFTMQLTAPLVNGTSYTMNFWDKGDIVCCAPGMPVVIGVSTVAGAQGTIVYTGPTPAGGTWTRRCFSFVAPNSGQYISVSTAGPTRWSHVDNFSFGSCPLPIELQSLKAVCDNNAVQVNWTTASEKNNDFFSVERSENGKDFTDIGLVKGAGTSYAKINYTFTDVIPLREIAYYRLKQTDADKSVSYSQIVTTEKCKNFSGLQFEIFPNPATDRLNVVCNTLNSILKITTALGAVIYETPITAQEMQINLSGFEAGFYFVHVLGEENKMIKKFIKN